MVGRNIVDYPNQPRTILIRPALTVGNVHDCGHNGNADKEREIIAHFFEPLTLLGLCREDCKAHGLPYALRDHFPRARLYDLNELVTNSFLFLEGIRDSIQHGKTLLGELHVPIFSAADFGAFKENVVMFFQPFKCTGKQRVWLRIASFFNIFTLAKV